MKPYCLSLLLVCLAPVLWALGGEYSASAAALSGVTMLSESVSDFSISPVITRCGFSASWQRPFGISDATTYGLHNAVPLAPFIMATGINYLSHPDYRWQDQYLSLELAGGGFALGATEHLIYEKIGDHSWYTWDNDLGLRWESGDYGTEIRYLHCRGADAALVLSALTDFGGGTTVCSSYTWRKDAEDSYAVATSCELVPGFLLQSSWQSEPARFGLGCKFRLDRWELMYSLRTHPELDLTHSVDLGVAW